MKKLMIMSVILASVSLHIDSVHANSSKCQAGYVVPLLHKGEVQENGDFVDFVVPGPGGRRYGVIFNNQMMKKTDFNTKTKNIFATAQVANVKTHWNPSIDSTKESCDIEIRHADKSVTKMRLFPYAYVQKK